MTLPMFHNSGFGEFKQPALIKTGRTVALRRPERVAWLLPVT
jgi:hypothetical protein